MNAVACLSATASVLLPGSSTVAQCVHPGPDATIGSIVGVANFAGAGDVDAFGVGVDICNIGDAPLSYTSSGNHPFMAQQAYRIVVRNGTSSIEQLGASWVFHTFSPLQGAVCCTCAPGTSTMLGAGCSSAESASIMSMQGGLSPRYQVDASESAFATPIANPAYSGSVARRLQVPIADLGPSSDWNQYIAEVQVFAADESATENRFNNVSSRPVTVSGGGAWNVALSGSTQRRKAAIQLWREYDASVIEASAIVPNPSSGGPAGGEGMYIVSSQATLIDDGVWHYELAVYNMNSSRAARELRVPVPEDAAIWNIGFHDVSYHDGDGAGNVTIDGTDWPAERAGDSLAWSTSTYQENPNANALRWGTLYNFRFDSNLPPALGVVSIGLFRPEADGPESLEIFAQVPQASGCPTCAADYDQDGGVTGADLAAFFLDYESGAACADVDDDGGVTGGDLGYFFTVFEAGGC